MLPTRHRIRPRGRAVLAVLALVAALASRAPATEAPELYGRLDQSLTWSDTGRATHEGVAGTVLENNFTRVGLSGTAALAPAWELFYRLEVGVRAEDTDTTPGPFSSRPTYVGVAGPAGRLAVGRIDPVFKMAKGFVDAFDNYATKHDRLLPGDRRHGDSLEYRSPSWRRLQAGVSALLEDEAFAPGDPRRDNANLQAALTWGDKRFRGGDVYAAVAWNDGLEDFKGTRLVGMVKAGPWTVGALAQWTELALPGAPDADARDGFGGFVHVTRRLGPWKLKVQAGRDDSGTGLIARRAYADPAGVVTAVPEVRTLAVGCERFFRPDLRLHTEWGRYLVAGAAGYDDTVVSLGLRYDFAVPLAGPAAK